MDGLGIGEKVVNRIDWRKGRSFLAGLGEKLVGRNLQDLFSDQWYHREPILEPLDHLLEARVHGEVRPIDDSAQPRILIVLNDQAHDVPVGGFPTAEEVLAHTDIVAQRRIGTLHHGFGERKRTVGVDHRNLDSLAALFGITLPGQQRGEHTTQGRECRRLVSHCALH